MEFLVLWAIEVHKFIKFTDDYYDYVLPSFNEVSTATIQLHNILWTEAPVVALLTMQSCIERCATRPQITIDFCVMG